MTERLLQADQPNRSTTVTCRRIAPCIAPGIAPYIARSIARCKAKLTAQCTAMLAAMLALLPGFAWGQQDSEGTGLAAGQQSIEAYLSEDALQVFYGREMDIGELGRNEVRAGVFLNEDRDLIGMADMLFDVGEPDRRPYWSLQVGPRAYGALMTIEDQDVFSIGLGGRLSYFLGRNRASSVSLTAFYAPDIVTFGNADNIKDVSVRLETRLSETTNLFIGYRVFEFDLEIDREVDDNMHVGIRHRF